MNFIERDGAIIGFRPEAFLPAELIPDKDLMKLRFRVERVENLGSYRLIYGTIGDKKVISNLSLPYPIKEREEYDFSVRLQDIRYFDKEKGVRIKR